jgi:hypothetical protein
MGPLMILAVCIIVPILVMGTVYWLMKDMKFEEGDLITER